MRFLYKEPAVLYKKALVIGDTHFGIEQRLKERGIYDETFSERIENKIEALIQETKAEKLIINGDVKDKIAVLDDSTSIVVNHNMSVRPTIVIATPRDNLTSATFWYIDTVTDTQFTLHVNDDVTADVSFYWKAEYE